MHSNFISFQGGPGAYMFHQYAVGPIFGLLFLLVLAEIVLKGFALWRAARLEKLPWFIALLLINSAGILPIIFLLVTKDEYDKLPKKKKLM